MGSKAAAGAGSVALSSALVIVALWAVGLQPPQEVTISLKTLCDAALAYAAVYFTHADTNVKL